MQIWHYIRLARPSHWVKNLIIFFPVIFAMKMRDPGAWLRAAVAAVGFCLVSSAVYVLNDLRDRERDRMHPTKRHRPLASGTVGTGGAMALAGVCLIGGMGIGATMGLLVAGTLVLYLLLQGAYTLWLKEKMILDVMCIALGFVLRAAVGAEAIGVFISPWLLVGTFTVCLFLGFCKRFSEQAKLDAENKTGHRATLAGYSPQLLTHLTTLSAGLAIMSYLLYTTDAANIQRFGTPYLSLTFPVMVYAVFRFAMLSMMGRYTDPTDLILHDRPFLLTALLWLGMTVGILLAGRHMVDWFGGVVGPAALRGGQ